MELNREALIAYVYDVYSVEQAINQTDKDIYDLKKLKNKAINSVKEEISNTEQEKDNEVQKVITSYKKTQYNNKIGLFERKATLVAASVIAIFFFFMIKVQDKINNGFIMWLIIIIIITLLGLCAVFEDRYLLHEKKEKVDAINKNKKNNINIQINSINNSKKKRISEINLQFFQKRYDIEEKLNMYYRQKRDFKKVRSDLYNDLLLIPNQHQDLFSACFLYQYLITSKETDLHYIFDQLNQEKIIKEIRIVAAIQHDILITQRKVLVELQKQTNLLSKISRQMSSYTQLFEEKMDEIRSDIGVISDNQRAILDNQAVLYNAYIQNAINDSKNDEERNAYLKMIANSTKVSAMFERAHFLNLKFDRNWSGDY